jgi:hypothetical protein
MNEINYQMSHYGDHWVRCFAATSGFNEVIEFGCDRVWFFLSQFCHLSLATNTSL